MITEHVLGIFTFDSISNVVETSHINSLEEQDRTRASSFRLDSHRFAAWGIMLSDKETNENVRSHSPRPDISILRPYLP